MDRRDTSDRAGIRVFITYAHESQRHKDQVLELANRLRAAGVDAWIDRYEVAPARGWREWMRQQVEQADKVLLVCTETWASWRKGEGPGRRGRGVAREWIHIDGALYDGKGLNEKFIPVWFDEEGQEAVPRELDDFTGHALWDGLPRLVAHLFGRPEVEAPPLGQPSMEPAPVRSGGTSEAAQGTPIPNRLRAPLQRYLDWVSDWADAVPPFPGEPPRSLSSIYVDLDESSIQGEERETWLGRAFLPFDAQGRLRIEDLVDAEPTGRWTIQGDPGAGKSTLLRHLTQVRAQAAAAELRRTGALPPGAVPMLASLPVWMERAVAPEELAAEDFSQDHSLGTAEVREALAQVARSGQALLLLDGLDEVQPAEVDSCFAELARLVSRDERRGCGVVLTSRQFGYRRPHADFTELQLLPLTVETQRELLSRWLEDDTRVEGVLAQVEQHPSLRDLAANPFTLTLLALLAKGTTDDLPTRRLAVYAAVVDRLASGGSGARSRWLGLPPEHLRRGVQQLALALQRRHAGPWSADELHEEARGCADLTRRLPADPVAACEALHNDTGLVVPLDKARQKWRFIHRSLMEYLAAEALTQRSQGEVLSLVRELSGRPAWWAFWKERRPEEVGRWAEVFALYAGLSPEPVRVLLGLKALHPSLVERALANLDALPLDALVSAFGVEGGLGIELVRELVRRIASPEALATTLLRLARVSGDLEELQVIGAALVMRAPDDAEALDEVRLMVCRVAGEDLLGITGRPWVNVPAGSFAMGSPDMEKGRLGDEGPHHRVRLTRSFLMLATPVTQAMYLVVAASNPSRFTGDLRRPVENLTWNEAQEWCGALSLMGGRAFRLPAEAEWEYACRAGSTSRWCFGDDVAKLGNYAWYSNNSHRSTLPVAGKLPNAWGLYDMHGTVWEWCSDGSRSYEAEPADDPVGPSHGLRVLRGGTIWDAPSIVRSAYRARNWPGSRNGLIGFRCVLSPAASATTLASTP